MIWTSQLSNTHDATHDFPHSSSFSYCILQKNLIPAIVKLGIHSGVHSRRCSLLDMLVPHKFCSKLSLSFCHTSTWATIYRVYLKVEELIDYLSFKAFLLIFVTFVIIIIFAAAVTAKQKAIQSNRRPTIMPEAVELKWVMAT